MSSLDKEARDVTVVLAPKGENWRYCFRLIILQGL